MRDGACIDLSTVSMIADTAHEIDLVSFERHESCEMSARIAECDGILEAKVGLPVQWQIDAYI